MQCLSKYWDVDFLIFAYLKTHNEVVMWDRIVRRKEDALIDVVAPPKYPLRDMRYSFRCIHSFTCSQNVH